MTTNTTALLAAADAVLTAAARQYREGAWPRELLDLSTAVNAAEAEQRATLTDDEAIALMPSGPDEYDPFAPCDEERAELRRQARMEQAESTPWGEVDHG